MRQKEIEKIKKGDFVEHKHYGLCYVEDVQFDVSGIWFGFIIRPLTAMGYMTLRRHSQVLYNRLLEHSNRMIVSRVDAPIIPKIIFGTKKGYEVHEWKKLGEVSDKGKFSTKKLGIFKDKDGAESFIKEYEKGINGGS